MTKFRHRYLHAHIIAFAFIMCQKYRVFSRSFTLIIILLNLTFYFAGSGWFFILAFLQTVIFAWTRFLLTRGLFQDYALEFYHDSPHVDRLPIYIDSIQDTQFL